MRPMLPSRLLPHALAGAVIASAFMVLTFAAPAEAQLQMADCTDTELDGEIFFCRDEPDPAWVREAASRMGDRLLLADSDGDRFLLLARSDAEELRSCCSIQEPMARMEDGLFASQFRMRHLDEAHLWFVPIGATGVEDELVFEGANVRPRPEQRDTSGTIENLTLDSAAHGETRRLTLYWPPDFNPDEPFALLTLMDGGGAPFYARILEPMMEAGRLPPIVILGVPSGAESIVPQPEYDFDVRAADYLPGIHETEERFRAAGDRFSAHLSFVADEAMPLVEARLEGREPVQRIIAGFSNGAVFTHEAALMRPDAFTGAIVMSAGGRLVAEPGETARHVRFVLSAGLYELGFRVATREAAQTLRHAGFDVRYTDYPDGHSHRQTEYALIDGLMALLTEDSEAASAAQ